MIFLVISALLSKEESGIISNVVINDFKEMEGRLSNAPNRVFAGYINCFSTALANAPERLSPDMI